MTLGTLFSGYDGLALALGETPRWVSDIDPGACKILEHNYPGVPNLGDVSTVDWSQVDPVDVIAGGYPCQPFSTAGRRKGTDDERHLWPHFATAIRVLRPRVALLENVAGHLTLGFGDVLGDLAELGYDCRWRCVRASDVGACHRRNRVWIVATDTHGERLSGWPKHDGGPQDVQPERKPRDDAHGLGVGWGKYEPAIRRHEQVLGRCAPDPRDERGRLNPAFVEWMMMLPAGWVTDCGLTRTQELKALGNGVVPLQAMHGFVDDSLPSLPSLPTPTRRDHKGRNQRNDTTCLPGAINHLLPTPRVSDSNGPCRHGGGGA